MKHYFQPEDSSTCGQHCVAMIADITPEESIKLFKSRGGTRTKQVAKVLTYLGFKCEDKLKRFTDETLYKLSGVQIIKVKWTDERKFTHWMVVNKGKVYCSGCGVFDFTEENMKAINGKATSYLEINN